MQAFRAVFMRCFVTSPVPLHSPCGTIAGVLIKELRATFKEPDFPGFLNFRESLSRLSKLPKDWCVAFRSSKGIYLLTCPKTKEQYVGSATGKMAFGGDGWSMPKPAMAGTWL
jgi:hypothetical protein